MNENQRFENAVAELRHEAIQQIPLWKYADEVTNAGMDEIVAKYVKPHETMIEKIVSIIPAEQDDVLQNIAVEMEGHWNDHNDCEAIIEVCDLLVNNQFDQALERMEN